MENLPEERCTCTREHMSRRMRCNYHQRADALGHTPTHAHAHALASEVHSKLIDEVND